MQTLFDTNLHFDGVVHFRIRSEGMHKQIQLLGHVTNSARNSDSEEISKNSMISIHTIERDRDKEGSYLNRTFAPV